MQNRNIVIKEKENAGKNVMEKRVFERDIAMAELIHFLHSCTLGEALGRIITRVGIEGTEVWILDTQATYINSIRKCPIILSVLPRILGKKVTELSQEAQDVIKKRTASLYLADKEDFNVQKKLGDILMDYLPVQEPCEYEK